MAHPNIVNGTNRNDHIELSYTDAEGDKVTNSADAIVAGSGNDFVNGAGGDDVIYGDNAGSTGVDGYGKLTVKIASQAGAYNGALFAEITSANGSTEYVTFTNNYDANVGRTYTLDLDAGDSVRLGITAAHNTLWLDNPAHGRASHVTSNSAVIGVEDLIYHPDNDFNDVVLNVSVSGSAELRLAHGATIGNDHAPVTDDGDDTIVGGAGADTMFGEGGNDLFVVDDASHANGDTVIGGNGPDDKNDYDVLDLRGAGNVTINKYEDTSDHGAYGGVVTFEQGGQLWFSQIEEILKDDQSSGNQAPVAVDDAVGVVLNNDQKVEGDLSVLLHNDYDPDGDAITITSIDTISALGAKLTLHDTDGDGIYDSVCYDPTHSATLAALADGETATDTLTYTISDGKGGTSTATVSLTIAGSGAGNGGGSQDSEVADIAAETQYLTGTDGNDVFVINGVSSDYQWANFAEDNGLEGTVVWNIATGVHDILYNFEQVRFNDTTVNLDGSGDTGDSGDSGDNGGSNGGMTVENIVGEVQYLQGTDAVDTFVIDGNSSDFTWSTFTEDNGLEGAVVWNTATGDHDILYSFDALKFNDTTVDLGAAGGTGDTGSDDTDTSSDAMFVTDIVGEVQYLQGSDQTDTFIIEGNSADYSWGAFTEDDGTEGTVVWNTATGDHDVMYAFEQLQFDDQTVVLEDTPAS